MEPIRNRVAESEIEVFNLESLWNQEEVIELDIAPFLVEGLILREKSYRESLKTLDLSPFREKHVAVFCSTDAIIPTWAFMLLGSKLDGIARSVTFGGKEKALDAFFTRVLDQFDWDRYQDKIVVIKGCGSGHVTNQAYLMATMKLQQVARKIMYGEPCSSVPIWRRSKNLVQKAS